MSYAPFVQYRQHAGHASFQDANIMASFMGSCLSLERYASSHSLMSARALLLVANRAIPTPEYLNTTKFNEGDPACEWIVLVIARSAYGNAPIPPSRAAEYVPTYQIPQLFKWSGYWLESKRGNDRGAVNGGKQTARIYAAYVRFAMQHGPHGLRSVHTIYTLDMVVLSQLVEEAQTRYVEVNRPRVVIHLTHSGRYTESLSSQLQPSTWSQITAAHQPSTRRSGRHEDADAEPSMRTAPLAPNHVAKPSTRRLTFTAYYPMRVTERERGEVHEDERRMGWRRKIEVGVLFSLAPPAILLIRLAETNSGRAALAKAISGGALNTRIGLRPVHIYHRYIVVWAGLELLGIWMCKRCSCALGFLDHNP
ncbi:hypothetical protein DFH09DRAFT_1327544 [Mycena vulgaris]|nr:hypothetical protein DFH09DRAFT_1327544 [Mycena vulgaris]